MMLRLRPGRLRVRPNRWSAGLLPCLALLVGCSAGGKSNPSFALTVQQAKTELKQMRADPVTLRRPVVVLGGWGDVLGLPPAELAKQLRRATGDDRIISIGFGGCVTFEGCRARLMSRLEAIDPSKNDAWIREIDVIGFSMGGIVARYAALPPEMMGDESLREDSQAPGPLKIATLYTICTPHRGAILARYAPAGPLAMDMRPGSGFMQTLDTHLADGPYPVVCYTRVYDSIVGASNAAPEGSGAWWVYPPSFSRAHMDAYKDPRFVADLARRLRGETPYTTEYPAPLPSSD